MSRLLRQSLPIATSLAGRGTGVVQGRSNVPPPPLVQVPGLSNKDNAAAFLWLARWAVSPCLPVGILSLTELQHLWTAAEYLQVRRRRRAARVPGTCRCLRMHAPPAGPSPCGMPICSCGNRKKEVFPHRGGAGLVRSS